jgi:FkbM family methyltransferase
VSHDAPPSRRSLLKSLLIPQAVEQRDDAPDPEDPVLDAVVLGTAGRWKRDVDVALDSSGRPAAPPVATVDTDVGPLALPAYDEVILPALRDHGVWEREVGAWLRSALSPGMVVVNVGAHVGYYALLASHAVGPTGRVVAIEPEPVNHALLRLNIARNRAWNVTAIPAAGGATRGVIELTQSADNSGDHRAFRRADADASMVVEVPQVTVDDVAAGRRVDLAIIDTQGTDHLVIRGMKDTIAAWSPTMLVEFWPPGIREAGADPASVLDEYRALDYRLSVLDRPDLGTDPAGDVVLAAAAANRGEYIDLVLSRGGAL